MPDRLFADLHLAALYDLFSPAKEREDFGFYLPLIMSARAVLDVGCGTGALLHMAREAGHQGRLCGLEPALGMLAQARVRDDIEWLQGDLGSSSFEGEFDLVIMTGHAFQVFVEDDQIQAALTAIRAALTEGGIFAFETRNPAVCVWKRWTPGHGVEVTDDHGVTVRMERKVKEPVARGVVRFSHTFTSPSWDQPRTSQSTLRFLDNDGLSSRLAQAGFVIKEQHGDWDRSPLTAQSPEIITLAMSARDASAPPGLKSS